MLLCILFATTSSCWAISLSSSGASSELVWRQIESFARYSFNKAHSASYAVESYQSLFLKVHYPLEFMVAVINNFGGFYNTRVYVNEARKAGGTIMLPCVNKSNYYTALYGTEVYLGFIHIKTLEHDIAQTIELERSRNGEYTSLENFILRTAISTEEFGYATIEVEKMAKLSLQPDPRYS